MDTRSLIDSLESAPVGDGDLRGELFRVLPYQRLQWDRLCAENDDLKRRVDYLAGELRRRDASQTERPRLQGH